MHLTRLWAINQSIPVKSTSWLFLSHVSCAITRSINHLFATKWRVNDVQWVIDEIKIVKRVFFYTASNAQPVVSEFSSSYALFIYTHMVERHLLQINPRRRPMIHATRNAFLLTSSRVRGARCVVSPPSVNGVQPVARAALWRNRFPLLLAVTFFATSWLRK